MRIVLAPDSFKGSISALEVAHAMNEGVIRVFPNANVSILPMADGGEGTVETLVSATNGQLITVEVTDPLGGKTTASYGVLSDCQTCVIEMACASGLHLVEPQNRNPLITTTYGTGELIKDALDRGFRRFILGIGGSATNDGGAGMLQALGLKLLDQEGQSIGFGGAELQKLHTIDLTEFNKEIAHCEFLIASDVDNPFVGENGASNVFGPQKGATPAMIEQLDAALHHFADCIEKQLRKRIHELPGAGAAGGLGGAFLAFFPAVLQRGVDIIAETIKLEDAIKDADLVITGEGQTDFQTKYGKTPMGVAQVAQRHGVDVIIISGSIGEQIEDLYPYGVLSIHSIMDRPMTLEEAMKNSAMLLTKCTEQIVRTYFRGKITCKLKKGLKKFQVD